MYVQHDNPYAQLTEGVRPLQQTAAVYNVLPFQKSYSVSLTYEPYRQCNPDNQLLHDQQASIPGYIGTRLIDPTKNTPDFIIIIRQIIHWSDDNIKAESFALRISSVERPKGACITPGLLS